VALTSPFGVSRREPPNDDRDLIAVTVAAVVMPFAAAFGPARSEAGIVPAIISWLGVVLALAFARASAEGHPPKVRGNG
jgi:hypothetical protein